MPYTSRAKKVLELAMTEARELNHSYVGTEHLLLGLLREEKGIAAQVLTDAGVNLEQSRAETLRLLGSDMPQASASGDDTPLASRFKTCRTTWTGSVSSTVEYDVMGQTSTHLPHWLQCARMSCFSCSK